LRKALLPGLLAALVLAAAFGVLGRGAAPPSVETDGPVWRMRSGDLVYWFHATFRVEKLFDAERDPRELQDLSAARPEEVRRLRAAFLKRLRLPSLDRVPEEGRRWLEDMMRNGYWGDPDPGGSGR
jgi:hypothetical protein